MKMTTTIRSIRTHKRPVRWALAGLFAAAAFTVAPALTGHIATDENGTPQRGTAQDQQTYLQCMARNNDKAGCLVYVYGYPANTVDPAQLTSDQRNTLISAGWSEDARTGMLFPADDTVTGGN